MQLRKIFGCLVLLTFASICFAQSAWAVRVIIDITKPFAKKLPLAIPDFLPIEPAGAKPADLSLNPPKQLSDNLDMTGMFITVDKRSYLENNPRAGLGGEDAINFEEWQTIGTELLVKGAFASTGDDLTLEMRLYDVFEGRLLLGKRYTGTRKDAYKMINRFTNEMMYVLTGEWGVFGTTMAFVAGSRADKTIMLTEFGGKEVKGVSGKPSTQPAMSTTGELAYIHRNGKSWELIRGQSVVSAGPLHLSPAFTPDGGLLAAISGKYDTNIYRFSGPGVRPQQITNHWGINISPTVSPDGGRMAFVSDRSGGPQIYVSSTSGGSASRFTTEGKRNTDPNWSPKGDKIVWCQDDREIYIANADGSDVKPLTSGTGINQRPTFSPDGRLILFSSNRLGRWQMFVMTVNGERQLPVLPDYRGAQKNPYWSLAQPEGAPGGAVQ